MVTLDSTFRNIAEFRAELAAERATMSEPLRVHVPLEGGYATDPERFEAYAAYGHGIPIGEPHFDDDAFDARIATLVADPVAVVSFSHGLPPQRAVDALHAAGSEVWMTVTSPEEAREASAHGADALIVSPPARRRGRFGRRGRRGRRGGR
jgi:nitronate monooxygenase